MRKFYCSSQSLRLSILTTLMQIFRVIGVQWLYTKGRKRRDREGPKGVLCFFSLAASKLLLVSDLLSRKARAYGVVERKPSM